MQAPTFVGASGCVVGSLSMRNCVACANQGVKLCMYVVCVCVRIHLLRCGAIAIYHKCGVRVSCVCELALLRRHAIDMCFASVKVAMCVCSLTVDRLHRDPVLPSVLFIVMGGRKWGCVHMMREEMRYAELVAWGGGRRGGTEDGRDKDGTFSLYIPSSPIVSMHSHLTFPTDVWMEAWYASGFHPRIAPRLHSRHKRIHRRAAERPKSEYKPMGLWGGWGWGSSIGVRIGVNISPSQTHWSVGNHFLRVIK